MPNTNSVTPTEDKGALAVKETGAIATQGHRLGFEKMDTESVMIPIAKLLQPTSPEITQEEFSDYGFKAGNIVHSLLLEKLPDTFIPLSIYDDKICFVPKQDAAKAALKARVKELFNINLADDDFKGQWVCRANDNASGDKFGSCENCPLCAFNGNEKPFCGRNINVLALFDGQDLPVVLRFSNTSHKYGRKFKSVAYYAGGNLFGRKYKVVTAKKTGNGNTWYEMQVQPCGKVDDAGELAHAEALYKQFLGVTVATEEVGPEEDVTLDKREF